MILFIFAKFLGRLINRFTRDIDTADSVLHMSFRGVILYVFRVFVTFAIISMQTFWFVVALVPIIICYLFIQIFYIALSRQLKRLESTTRSPIYSHFQETISGSSSIRAFDVENEFIQECFQRVDKNHKIYYPNICAARWLSVRLEFLGKTVKTNFLFHDLILIFISFRLLNCIFGFFVRSNIS